MNTIQRIVAALVILGSLLSLGPEQPANAVSDSPQLVKDINEGEYSSNLTEFASLNGRALFFADDYDHGMEPWITDGTQGGTYMVKDTVPKQFSGLTLQSVVSTGKVVYFDASNSDEQLGTLYRLWRTDGTADGTVPIPPATEMGSTIFVRKMVVSGQDLYVLEGGGPAGLYVFSGGSFRLLHMWDATVFQNNQINDMLVYGSTVYVMIQHRDSRVVQLWKTDVTTGATVKIVEMLDESWVPTGPLAAANGLLFLRMGGRLYQSNGEVGNLEMVDGDYALRFHTSSLVSYGSAVLFTATESADRNKTNLYITSGKGSGIVKLAEYVLDELQVINGRVYFAMYGETNGGLLGRTDGTLPGTVILTPEAGSYRVIPFDVVEVGSQVFFLAWTKQATEPTENRPVQMWVSDGTPGGAHLLGSIEPGLTLYDWGYLTKAGAYLVFTSNYGSFGNELLGQKVLPYGLYLPVIQR